MYKLDQDNPFCSNLFRLKRRKGERRDLNIEKMKLLNIICLILMLLYFNGTSLLIFLLFFFILLVASLTIFH